MINELPHFGTYTRIKPSKEHGVGVFAIVDIPQNTPIFYGDENTPTKEVPEHEIEQLPSEIRQLYIDFCPLNNGIFTCPTNFNLLTPAWYLNCSEERPNVICKDGYIFYSSREIKAGEELLVDYSTYSE